MRPTTPTRLGPRPLLPPGCTLWQARQALKTGGAAGAVCAWLDMAGIITAPVASATRPKPITLCTLDSPSCLLVLFTGKLFQYDRKIKRQNERSVD